MQKRNTFCNTFFQKMEEFRRLTRRNSLSRIEKQHLAECSILPLVIIFDRSYSSLKETVCVSRIFVYSQPCNYGVHYYSKHFEHVTFLTFWHLFHVQGVKFPSHVSRRKIYDVNLVLASLRRKIYQRLFYGEKSIILHSVDNRLRLYSSFI